MTTNLLKRYNEFLELLHYDEVQRTQSLRRIFNRDISDNDQFLFRSKVIRPLKKEGEVDMETLFAHLTKKTQQTTDENGRKISSRDIFDIERSKRLHWIWHHIQELKNDLKIFSNKERKDGRDVVRTYIYDEAEEYVIVLEPQRSNQDYYLLSAYYLDEPWASKNMRKKWKRKLQELY